MNVRIVDIMFLSLFRPVGLDKIQLNQKSVCDFSAVFVREVLEQQTKIKTKVKTKSCLLNTLSLSLPLSAVAVREVLERQTKIKTKVKTKSCLLNTLSSSLPLSAVVVREVLERQTKIKTKVKTKSCFLNTLSLSLPLSAVAVPEPSRSTSAHLKKPDRGRHPKKQLVAGRDRHIG